ncbi:MAG: signal peptidase I [Pseudomonadota bacterium]
MAKAERARDGIWETVQTIFWALLIAAAFRSVLFQPFSIPSGSMKPTLLVGDYLFVSKYSYGYSRFSLPFSPNLFDGRIWPGQPQRGDVIVFKHPRQDACSEGPIDMVVGLAQAVFGRARAGAGDCTDYVKRLVGLPGDQVQVIAGVLHLNGEPVPTVSEGVFSEEKALRGSPARPPQCNNEPVPLGGECEKELYRETLPGGREHWVLNTSGTIGDRSNPGLRSGDDTGIFEVPEGHFFFMGDNRDNSIDSRFPSVGVVPFENLIGRADIIVISSDGAFWEPWKWRASRFFKSIE